MTEDTPPPKESVLLDVDNRGVATLTLNRPEKHNAFDSRLIYLLQEKLDQIKSNNAVRVVVLKAEGKSFSAGADLNWMKDAAKFGYDENVEDAESLALVLHSLNHLSVPTIACVQGAAFGGAVGLVSCCDIVLASECVKFALSEVKIGLIPAVISPYVIRAIGERHARRLFLTAENFSALEAQQLGLVSKVLREEKLHSDLDSTIERLLLNSPAAMSEAKALIADVAGKEVDKAMIKLTSEWIAKVRISVEGQEGLNAFLEKRLPNWACHKDKRETEG